MLTYWGFAVAHTNSECGGNHQRKNGSNHPKRCGYNHSHWRQTHFRQLNVQGQHVSLHENCMAKSQKWGSLTRTWNYRKCHLTLVKQHDVWTQLQEQDSSESEVSGRESPGSEKPPATEVLAVAKFDKMRKESVRNQTDGSHLERKGSKGFVRTLKDAITEFRKLPRQSLILVATTLLLILLFLSAAVLLYRIHKIQNRLHQPHFLSPKSE